MLLTKRQREVLTIMAEADEEIVSEGWDAWIGFRRTSVALIYSLLRLCAISESSFSGETYHIYTINSTGRELLRGVVSDELKTVLAGVRGEEKK